MNSEVTHFDFGQIIKLSENIFETIIDEGVEMTVPMMNEYHCYFKERANGEFGVLVNRVNSYTYEMEVQQKIGHMPNMKALAVLTYSKINELSTQLVYKLPSNRDWNLEMFRDKDAAINWLLGQLVKG